VTTAGGAPKGKVVVNAIKPDTIGVKLVCVGTITKQVTAIIA
jgi:hypothetical protein